MSRVVVALVLAVTLGACDEKPKRAADVQTMEQLKAAGKGPLELVSATRSIAPLPNAAVFAATVKNRSDRKVSMFKVAMVALDGDNKPIELADPESGWGGELAGLPAGETVQFQVMVPSEKAARLKLVFRQVMYETPNPMGEKWPDLTMVWKNPKADEELAALKTAP